jgi:hypothetical protein
MADLPDSDKAGQAATTSLKWVSIWSVSDTFTMVDSMVGSPTASFPEELAGCSSPPGSLLSLRESRLRLCWSCKLDCSESYFLSFSALRAAIRRWSSSAWRASSISLAVRPKGGPRRWEASASLYSAISTWLSCFR